MRKLWPTLLFATLPLLGFWLYGLFDLDEGFYAAVVSEMNRRGDWITPWYNGQPWFEKPILLYWFAKPSVAIFGEMIGPRLPSVLANVGLMALCGWFALRHWGQAAARWTIFILGSSLFVVAVGRLMMTDSLFVLCFAAALIWFYESLTNPKFRYLSAFALGLSVLAKGPVGAILFVGILITLFIVAPNLRPAFRGGWLIGTLIFAATVATWYYPCWKVNGEVFVQKFLIEQNISRFTGGDKAHTVGFLKGLPIYPITLIAGLAPWSFAAFRRRFWSKSTSHLHPLLLSWFGVVFTFFLISGAKLPHYILPCAPPLALLIAHWRKSDERPWPLIAVATTIFITILTNTAFIIYYQQGHAEVHRLARYARAGGGPVAVYQMPRRDNDRGTGTLHLRETSHPSLVYYLNATVIDAETPDQLGNARWIITRQGRIKNPAEIGFRIAQEGRDYVLLERQRN